MPKPVAHNTLFYDNNLPILRDYVRDESIYLIYLDPSFNSNRSYNELFKDERGAEAKTQIAAFDDPRVETKPPNGDLHKLIQNAPVRIWHVQTDREGQKRRRHAGRIGIVRDGSFSIT